jgi:hypothetical protein
VPKELVAAEEAPAGGSGACYLTQRLLPEAAPPLKKRKQRENVQRAELLRNGEKMRRQEAVEPEQSSVEWGLIAPREWVPERLWEQQLLAKAPQGQGGVGAVVVEVGALAGHAFWQLLRGRWQSKTAERRWKNQSPRILNRLESTGPSQPPTHGQDLRSWVECTARVETGDRR